MDKLSRLLRVALLILPMAAASPTAASGAQVDPLDKAWAEIESPGQGLGSREIMEFILEAAGRPDYGQRSAQIDTAFQRLERMQDRDSASKTYGNFCWYWHEAKPGDLNAVEFVTQQAGLLKLRFAPHLSPAARDGLDRLLGFAVEGIERHPVDVGYTNIYLMKIWNLLALGEALKRPELTREGSAMLDHWMEFTSQNGIREFLSPTYYGIDLDSLGLMAGALSTPAVHEKAQRILRVFWSDIAANWFQPAGRLGGAHGRDYDYLTGHGDLDRHLLDAGWIDSKQFKPPPFQVFAEATRWLPPEMLHKQALSEIPRFVYQKWDVNAWASQYVGHRFSIGVSSRAQGPEDKPFALNLAGPAGPKTVMVNFFMDGRNDPYGHNKIPTGPSGHSKAHHLYPFFCAAQSGPEVLFLAAYPFEGRKAEAPPACLFSQMDLPSKAEVWTASGPTDPSQPSQPLPGNLCFLRMGDIAVGIQFMLALDTAGKAVTAQVVNDGMAYGARRLTVTHSSGPPETGQGVVAVRVRAEEGLDDAKFAAFRRSFADAGTSATIKGSVIQLEASGLKNSLALKADLAASRLLDSRGATPQGDVMSINGKEFCRDLLQK